MNKYLERTMRWAQLTICEGDMENFDPDRWLKYMDDSACDGLVLGSGGYMAFHDTDIPYHYTVKHPKHDDVFGYMVEACRKKGYGIICRTDSHACHDDAFRAHPEWAAVTKDGEPRKHWSFSDVWVTCPLGDYGFDFMNKVHGELAAKYDMDAIFCNRWPGSGVCYCESCKKSFREFSGREIPKVLDPQDETTQLYMQWHSKRAFELCKTWDSEIIRNNPNMRFIPNSNVGTTAFIDNKLLGDYSDVLFADYQGREGLMTPWFNGMTGKQLHAVLGDKPVGGIFSTGTTERRWKDSVQEKTELELWVSEAVANGLRPWFTKFSVQVFDERWMPVVTKLYNKYRDWEKYLRNTKSKAEVALAFSQHTAMKYASAISHHTMTKNAKDMTDELVNKPIYGFYHALIEARIPFDMIDSHYFDKEHLERYKAVILPNVAVLSDADCAALREYVENGGALIATYETSLYDENGKRRDDFGLASLFGVHSTGDYTANELNAYISVVSRVNSPVLREGFGAADARIIGTENRVGIKFNPADFEESPFKAVPAFPDLPMEEVYPRDLPANYEEVLYRKVGKGRVVYFCGDIGRCYWEYMAVDHRRLIANSVRWSIDTQDTVRVETPGLVDVTLWENEEGLMVHLVNMSTPNAMRGAASDILPLSNVTISVRNDLAGNGKVLSLENAAVSVRRGENYTKITLPDLKLHEVLVLS